MSDQESNIYFQLLHRYNLIFKENDDLYRRLADQFGLPDSAFWILYCLRESRVPITQKQLCEWIYYSKQTVNSGLKSLERSGYITLEVGKDRRSKQILLTDSGKKLASKTVDQIIQKEQQAIASMGNDAMEQFLLLFRIYTDALKQQFQTLNPVCRDENSIKENSDANSII